MEYFELTYIAVLLTEVFTRTGCVLHAMEYFELTYFAVLHTEVFTMKRLLSLHCSILHCSICNKTTVHCVNATGVCTVQIKKLHTLRHSVQCAENNVWCALCSVQIKKCAH